MPSATNGVFAPIGASISVNFIAGWGTYTITSPTLNYFIVNVSATSGTIGDVYIVTPSNNYLVFNEGDTYRITHTNP